MSNKVQNPNDQNVLVIPTDPDLYYHRSLRVALATKQSRQDRFAKDRDDVSNYRRLV